MRAQVGLTVAVVFLVLAADGAAQCDHSKLLPSDGGSGSEFGFALDVRGDRALIGSTGWGADEGAAYAFEYGVGGWTEVQRLVPNESQPQSWFGSAVSLDGDQAAIGALLYPGYSSRWGAVYLFERVDGSWVEQELLLSNAPGYEKQFGRVLSLQGDRLAIGEPGPYPNPGAVHLFERSGGSWQRVKVYHSQGEHNYFGDCLDLDGDWIAIGAMGLDGSFELEGRVFVGERIEGTWSHYQPVQSTTPVEQGFFGQAVALEGDRLVVGAPRETGRTVKSGAVHVYEHDGTSWQEVARLIAPDGEPHDQFGIELALEGDRLAVGAWFDDVGARDCGSVYIFDRGPAGWSLTLKQSPHDPSEDQYFGAAVGLVDSRIVVGAMGDDELGNSCGAAYAVELDDSVVTYCQTAPNSAGDGARISTAGSVSLSQNDFHLAAEGLPPGKLGKFFYGPSSLQLPFGNGTLCVGGQVFRLDPVLSTATGNGFDWVDFSALPASSGAGQIAPGSTWNFQYWYRDPDAGGANLNLTDALRVTFCP